MSAVFVRVLAISLVAPTGAWAAAISVVGSLPTAAGVAILPLSLDIDGDIVVQTFGYGGGVNVAGDVIDGVGFLPVVFVFDSSGPLCSTASSIRARDVPRPLPTPRPSVATWW